MTAVTVSPGLRCQRIGALARHERDDAVRAAGELDLGEALVAADAEDDPGDRLRATARPSRAARSRSSVASSALPR